MSRTQKDETKYDEQLRREESIKTEVILELREALRTAHRNNAVMTREAIRYSQELSQAIEALAFYRQRFADQSEQWVSTSSPCLPGCDRHEWRTEDGWHKKERP